MSYGRENVKELGDIFASPAGWHTLPLSHDPSVSEEERATFGRFRMDQRFDVRTYNVDIKGICIGARLRRRGVTTFSRTRTGRLEKLGCTTSVRQVPALSVLVDMR